MPRALRDADDRTLAEAVVQHGSERAFRELYRRHTPALYQFVLRVLGGAEAETEDVVQEAWIRVARKLSGFRWESSLRTWLSAIALNLAREALRRRGRVRTEEWTDGVAPVAPAPRDAERIDLEQAIARLPDGYRAVLVLHDIEGYTHEEIGRQLQIAVGTSKSQLFDARRVVRAYLKPSREMRHA